YINRAQLKNIKDYDYLLNDVANYQKDTTMIKLDNMSIELNRDSLEVIIHTPSDNIVLDLEIVIRDLVKEIKVVDQYNQLDPEELTYESENDRIKYKILFTSFSFRKDGDDIKNIRFPVFSMYFTIK
nr:hypothetical protein [Candidatus Delongbacteria bacterium]